MKMPEGICSWYLTITSMHACIAPAKFTVSIGTPVYCIIIWCISNRSSSSRSKNFLPQSVIRAFEIVSPLRRAKPIAKSDRKFKSRGVSAPTMPKSIIAITLPGMMKMLPACGSAWKNPCLRIIVSSMSAPLTAIRCVSSPAARSAGGSSGAMPRIRSITSSLFVQYRLYTNGICTVGSSLNIVWNR